MQTLAVGRVLHFYGNGNAARTTTKRVPVATHEEGALPCTICHVNNDGTVNVGGFDAHGEPFSAMGVQVLDASHEIPKPGTPESQYCVWPPRV